MPAIFLPLLTALQAKSARRADELPPLLAGLVQFLDPFPAVAADLLDLVFLGVVALDVTKLDAGVADDARQDFLEASVQLAKCGHRERPPKTDRQSGGPGKELDRLARCRRQQHRPQLSHGTATATFSIMTRFGPEIEQLHVAGGGVTG